MKVIFSQCQVCHPPCWNWSLVCLHFSSHFYDGNRSKILGYFSVFLYWSSIWLKILWIIVILSILTWALISVFRSGKNLKDLILKDNSCSPTLFSGSCTSLTSTPELQYWKYLTDTLVSSTAEIQTRLKNFCFISIFFSQKLKSTPEGLCCWLGA